ncbi:MAG: hypothetical protein KME08_11145, partial [Aphanothece sp. CMT-3BRIN-NPC111]|nr:hypothetical protein [Aphanothece sp. CMT-3BRIN-NPC111]
MEHIRRIVLYALCVFVVNNQDVSNYKLTTMKQVTTRVSGREYDHLAEFCKITERTQSEVIRELIRKLSMNG